VGEGEGVGKENNLTLTLTRTLTHPHPQFVFQIRENLNDIFSENRRKLQSNFLKQEGVPYPNRPPPPAAPRLAIIIYKRLQRLN